MNPIGINLWNWTPQLDEAALPLVAKVAALGFTAIELPMTTATLPEALAFKEAIDRCGLAVTLCASLTAGRDLSHPDEGVRRATREYFNRCLETAVTMGARTLAGPLYAGGGKRHQLPERERQQEWQRAVEELYALGKAAAEYGVQLAIEPINRYRTSVVNTTGQALAMVGDIGLANVGVLFDTYQSCIEDDSVVASLEQVLLEKKLFHFHACANHRGAPGTGHLPWKELGTLLSQHHYTGHLTMETFCPGALDPCWYPLAKNQDELALKGLHFLQHWL